MSKSKWKVFVPMVTGLKYDASYWSLGEAVTEPLLEVASTTTVFARFSAALRRLSGTGLPYLRRALTLSAGPFFRWVEWGTWLIEKVPRLSVSIPRSVKIQRWFPCFDVPSWMGFAAMLPARASAAVRLTMDGIVAMDRGDS